MQYVLHLGQPHDPNPEHAVAVKNQISVRLASYSDAVFAEWDSFYQWGERLMSDHDLVQLDYDLPPDAWHIAVRFYADGKAEAMRIAADLFSRVSSKVLNEFVVSENDDWSQQFMTGNLDGLNNSRLDDFRRACERN